MNPETTKAIEELRACQSYLIGHIKPSRYGECDAAIKAVITALETAERERDEAVALVSLGKTLLDAAYKENDESRAACGELRNIIRDLKVGVAFVTGMRPGSENAFVEPIRRADAMYEVGKGWRSPEDYRKLEAALQEIATFGGRPGDIAREALNPKGAA